MLAQVSDNSAGREDLLREGREWAESRLPRGSAKQTQSEIERHRVTIAHDRQRLR